MAQKLNLSLPIRRMMARKLEGFLQTMESLMSSGPREAVGLHAELLAELTATANALIQLVEAERAGSFDGYGADFWVGTDRVLDAARQLVVLAEKRANELRDAGPR